ncbi:MAG TPA: alpha/beta fold hydrolase [Sphingomicrobium sp.]|nr:alpha/beta fold hydrolase [Sphingomicrobium sp.]
MDALTDILGSLRLTGGVVIDGQLSGEFCLRSEFTPQHFAPFFPAPETLISYHYVRSGQMVVEVEGMPPMTVRAGEIAILPRNDPHVLESRAGLKPVEVDDIGWITEEGIHRVTSGSGGPPTEIWCGFLGTAKNSVHPLLDALPPLLTLDIDTGQEGWLDSSMRFLAEEKPSQEVVARLAELFLTQAVREYVDKLPTGAKGWLKGLADPAVSRALAIIHARYAEDLTVEVLAREAGVSRTVLGEKFAELLGEPPMRYCARWRMRMAANMLRDGKHNTANVAYAVGFNSEAAFNRAFKREYGEPPATWRRRIEAEEEAAAAAAASHLPAQTVRYCTAHDGTRLAWSVVGEGPPLVKTANWLNHLEHDWESPLWRHWMGEFLKDHCLVRYDERANGLSDWDTPEISFEAFVDDLESVVDCAGLDRFDLLGISQGAAVAIAYAVRHPERVRRMVLYGGYSQGWGARGDPEEIARREAMLTLTEVGWGADNPAYRQLFTNLYIPGASAEQADWFTEVQRISASTENSIKIQRALSQIDVTRLLPRVRVPTLVAHARDDQVVPFAAGEFLANRIKGAQFVPLEGQNHILIETEPAWPVFTAAVSAFLAEGEAAAPAIIRKPPKDVVRSCKARDGVRLAFAECGSGFPLLKAPNWMTHLEHDWTSPVYGHWIDYGSQANRLVRMDLRGFGKSDWDLPGFSFEHLVADLETVADEAGIEQCDLMGISHGAAIAMAFAARNPARVRKLVLVNSFAAGWRVRADPEEVAYRESLLEMNRQRPAFRRSLLGEMFITLYFPSASQKLIDWHNEHFATLGPVKNMEPMIELASRIDVRDELRNIRAETLVCHGDKDGNAPLVAGREVADAIAGARFFEFDGANHVPLGDEPAWPILKREIGAFLRS